MARVLRRGDIAWADLAPTRGKEQAGRRPVLILSRDLFNNKSGTVLAMAITSQEPRAGFPFTLKLTHSGLPKASWVKISQIRTLDTERLGQVIGSCSAETLEQILSGLYQIIGSA